MTQKNPLVTVLMPVYNVDAYVSEAVESILSQSFTDFEFLIIDDASTDSTVTLVERYNDARIKLVKKPVNTGLIQSLNMGLTMANGKYVARMDGDDYSYPERLAKQIVVMEDDASIGVCGTWFKLSNDNSIIRHPAEASAVKVGMLSRCVVGHPTAMLRKSTLTETGLLYDPEFKHAEDYRLWVALVPHCKIINIPEVLLDYRIHSAQVSMQKIQEQKLCTDQIRLMELAYLNIKPDRRQKDLHVALINYSRIDICAYAHSEIHEWLLFLYKQNQKMKQYDQLYFLSFLRHLWNRSLHIRAEYNVKILMADWRSIFSLRFTAEYLYLKFLLKCIFRFNALVNK